MEQYSLLRLEGENGKHDDMAEIFVRRATLYSCMGDHRAAFLDSERRSIAIHARSTVLGMQADFVEVIQMFQHGLKMSRENVY